MKTHHDSRIRTQVILNKYISEISFHDDTNNSFRYITNSICDITKYICVFELYS